MKIVGNTRKWQRGFTIIELLVVVSVISILATLVTGAAIKAVKQSRERRVQATMTGLGMALMNYRARENGWPEAFKNKTPETDGTVWFHGTDNAKVFKDLIAGGSDGNTRYLDGAAILVSVNGKRMSLYQALKKSASSDKAIGYAWPEDQNVFGCFCIEYNPLTDTVKVHRPDMRRAPYGVGDRVEGDHTCPVGYVKVN